MKLVAVLWRLNNVSLIPARFKEALNLNVRPGFSSAFTNVIQTGLLTGVGDIIAQHYVENTAWKDHNIWRTIRLTSVGLFVIGPIFHVWYDVFLSKLYIQRTAGTALKKVVLDQGLFAPTFLLLFYGSIGLFEMSPIKKTVGRIKTEFVPNMAVNYFIWPAVQMVNFFYINKPQYNILLVNTVSVFWNSFLSWAAHKKVHTTPKFHKENISMTEELNEENSKMKTGGGFSTPAHNMELPK